MLIQFKTACTLNIFTGEDNLETEWIKKTRHESNDTGYTWMTKSHNCTWRVLEEKSSGKKVPLCYFGGKTVSISMKWLCPCESLPTGLEIHVAHGISF